MDKEQKQKPMTQMEMQKATEEIMRELGMSINAALKAYFPGSGFTLITFPFGKPGICNYISNAERSSMLTALKETVKKLELKEDIPAASGAIH